MWSLLTLLICGILCSISLGEITSSNYFCADMNPQPHVIIDQLMGIWYGIEIISHIDEQHYVRYASSCPIIHLSEDKTYSTTFNPLHRNYNYGYNYGENPTYTTYRTQYSRTQDYNNQRQQHYPQYAQQEYDRRTTPYYDSNYANTRHYGQNDYIRRENQEMKHIRLLWDENGSSTEYQIRYNVSRAGFWISAGPQNGSSLEPQFSHFAGTIQVIKAVGNHLVLTFCHRMPDKELYSILLARENKLDSVEIHGVHNLLNRKGLNTNAVKKVCNSSARNILSTSIIFLTFLHKIFR